MEMSLPSDDALLSFELADEIKKIIERLARFLKEKELQGITIIFF